jgi:uncharacterized protein (DUF433 family)
MSSLDVPQLQKAPLVFDSDGVMRVGGTRVRLETVIGAFVQGCTAEEIMLRYPALDLTQIYAVIAYYLQHRDAVEAYLEERRSQREESERELESRFPSAGVRDRLLARRKAGP